MKIFIPLNAIIQDICLLVNMIVTIDFFKLAGISFGLGVIAGFAIGLYACYVLENKK